MSRISPEKFFDKFIYIRNNKGCAILLAFMQEFNGGMENYSS
ncbi:hypothetical protein I33_2606 [Bacillus subtilis subsp. subtilis str. RO-NN-1]|nr:hypothetical protein I33_2606 [Bacillus subtilis subsp. subtilis str. RO-NN-1]